MNPEDMIMISVDDHVVEPPDMFEQHLTPEWKARAPRVTQLAGGADVWEFERRHVAPQD